MSQADTTTVHPDALELAELLRPTWPELTRALRASGVPLNEGGGEGGDGGEGGGSGEGGDGEAGEGGGSGGGEGGQESTFPREVVEKLRRENAAARKRAQEAETRVKEFEDRDKSDQQRAEEAAKAAAERAAEAETRLLRFEVAAEKDVPQKLAKFLTGSTKKELEDSAAELLAELGNTRRTSFDGGTRDGAPPPKDMDAAIRHAAGRG